MFVEGVNDRQIGEIVYEFYGLTKKEILIMGKTNGKPDKKGINMKLSWSIYSVLFIVIVLSIVFTMVLPAEDIMKYVYSSPGILALLGVLYQLLRDDTKHQKELIRQHDQQAFDLGATTHMADVVFDKHVLFCEEYMKEMLKAMETLFRKGLSSEGLDLASSLLKIRIYHATWLTNEIDEKLQKIEQAIRAIGAAAAYYDIDPKKAVASGEVDEKLDILKKVLNFSKETPDPDIAIETGIKQVRNILGIEGLTNLRRKLITEGL